jgi:hypothetical protein
MVCLDSVPNLDLVLVQGTGTALVPELVLAPD